MSDVTSFINGIAIPETHEDFMVLMAEAHRNVDLINTSLREILGKASVDCCERESIIDRDGIIHDGSETKGG